MAICACYDYDSLEIRNTLWCGPGWWLEWATDICFVLRATQIPFVWSVVFWWRMVVVVPEERKIAGLDWVIVSWYLLLVRHHHLVAVVAVAVVLMSGL